MLWCFIVSKLKLYFYDLLPTKKACRGDSLKCIVYIRVTYIFFFFTAFVAALICAILTNKLVIQL